VSEFDEKILKWEQHQNDLDKSKEGRRTPRWGRLDLSILFTFAIPGVAVVLLFLFGPLFGAVDPGYSKWGWRIVAVLALFLGWSSCTIGDIYVISGTDPGSR
jgi:hypothetical protein